jgi:hypothetical protein
MADRDDHAAAPAGPHAGLCETCRFQRVVNTTRGSRFSLCNLSREDASYPRYPRLPVLECRGYRARGEAGATDEGTEASD